MEKFHNLDKVLNAIGRHIKEDSTIAVYGDYDVDGLMSLMIFKDTLNSIPHCKVKCFPYSNRTHDIDFGFVNFCLINSCSLAIICDTGSNSMDTLDRLIKYGIEVVVLDHHTTPHRYSTFPDKSSVISTYLDKTEHGIENVMCGAGIAFLVCSALLERLDIDYDIGRLGVYSLLGMYADSVVLDTEFGRFLYQTVESREEIPRVIDYFTGEFMTINRRFAEWWFAPKVNAAFRREQFSVINQLFVEESGDPSVLIKEITDLHVSTMRLIEGIVPKVIIKDFGKVVMCNLSEFLRDDYPQNFILNHKGRVANAIASKTGKACICVCDSGECIEGSLRDPVSREWLKFFSPLFESGGHQPAFGFKIPYVEWSYFETIVQKISESVSDKMAVDNEVVDLRRGIDPYVLDTIAFENEFSHPENPPTFVLASLRSIKESHKYSDYSYLLSSDGSNSIWINSDRRILYPMDVVLYPYKSSKTKLKAVWG